MNNYQLQFEPLLGDFIKPIHGKGDTCPLDTHKQSLIDSQDKAELLARLIEKAFIGLVWAIYISYSAFYITLNFIVNYLTDISYKTRYLISKPIGGRSKR